MQERREVEQERGQVVEQLCGAWNAGGLGGAQSVETSARHEDPGRGWLTLVLPYGLPVEEERPAPKVAAKHKQPRRRDFVHLGPLGLGHPALVLEPVLGLTPDPACPTRALALDLLRERLVVGQEGLVLGQEKLVLDRDLVARL